MEAFGARWGGMVLQDTACHCAGHFLVAGTQCLDTLKEGVVSIQGQLLQGRVAGHRASREQLTAWGPGRDRERQVPPRPTTVLASSIRPQLQQRSAAAPNQSSKSPIFLCMRLWGTSGYKLSQPLNSLK